MHVYGHFFTFSSRGSEININKHPVVVHGHNEGLLINDASLLSCSGTASEEKVASSPNKRNKLDIPVSYTVIIFCF